MKPPFDIAADLDTPVSAYLKLAPFRPRFLLESVEGGERLARYSFIGFGDCLEVRLDAVGTPRRRAPLAAAGFQGRVAGRTERRAALERRSRSPRFPVCRSPEGWWDTRPTTESGTSSISRGAASIATVTPHAHYVAPCSLLVFDHLTRSAALLHDGSEAERQSLRREVMRALRGAVPTLLTPGSIHAGSTVACPSALTRTACGAPRSTSPRATYTSWCSRRVSRDVMRWRRSRSIGPCVC